MRRRSGGRRPARAVALEQRQESSPPSGQDAAYATRGLTAVHVLARYCSDVALVQTVIARTPHALSERAGFYRNGKAAQGLPMHLAAAQNSSVDVVRLLLESGGAEQLQVKDQGGLLPMHLAAGKNSSVDVVRLLLESGGAEQLQVKDQHGDVPLHLAAFESSSVDVVRLLLGRGSPRFASARYDSSLGRNRSDIAELLIKAGVEMPEAVIRQLPQRLREIAARVSVSLVLSSYFDDNISPFGAAVRSPP